MANSNMNLKRQLELLRRQQPESRGFWHGVLDGFVGTAAKADKAAKPGMWLLRMRIK